MFLIPACVLFLAQVPVLQPPRLRTILPNGAVILVEKHAGAKRLDLQLFVSAQSTPETPKTHGLRHLLEHMEARGPSRDLDRRLETRGAFLTAETLRDATEFHVSLRPADLQLGLEAVTDLMQLGAITKEDIVKEAETIRQEEALQEPDDKFSVAAWSTAYGTDGLDPAGDPAQIAKFTPDDLTALHRNAFRGPNLVLVISGDVDLDEGTRAASGVLGPVPAAAIAALPVRTGHPGEATSDVPGQARAVLVRDFNSVQTAARLAAAFGLASGIPGAFVTYTPSQRGALILVGATGSATGFGAYVDGADPARSFAAGRGLARLWIERQIGPNSDGFLRGLLLVQGAGVRPETMIDNLRTMGYDDYQRAVEEFRSGSAVRIEGR